MTEEQWHLLYFYFFCLEIRFKKHVFFCELAFLKSNHDSTLDVCEWNSKKNVYTDLLVKRSRNNFYQVMRCLSSCLMRVTAIRSRIRSLYNECKYSFMSNVNTNQTHTIRKFFMCSTLWIKSDVNDNFK